MEFETEVRGDPPVKAQCHFYISGLPADFNRIGKELAEWIRAPSERLQLKWQDG